jgi:hypothetical protein
MKIQKKNKTLEGLIRQDYTDRAAMPGMATSAVPRTVT